MSAPHSAAVGYPDLGALAPDPVAVRILSAAYATSTGELNSALQYLYASLCFKRCGDGARAELLKDVSRCEMQHLALIGEALSYLGAQPVYSALPPAAFNFYSTKFVAYPGSLKNVLEDSVACKKHAIFVYERMLPRLKNDELKLLVCRILEDEHAHLESLKSALGQYEHTA